MNHEKKLNNIIKQLKNLSVKNQSLKLIKDSTSHFVPDPHSTRSKLPRIDIRYLNEIIDINTEQKICIAEAGLTFSDMVRATLKHGLIPYNVPELKTITIGGAVAGCSMESMSYRFGGFHDNCLEYEVITGKGEVITCSCSKNSDIFNMLHGSYGTLGIITKIKFNLLPAKLYVRMDYKVFEKFEDFWNFIKKICCTKECDFIDGIIHSRNRFVVCMATMVEQSPFLNSYNWIKIYYQSTLKSEIDFLTTYDYVFRYDTECHWMTKTIPFMENVLMRFLFGKAILGSDNLIKWAERAEFIMKLKKRPEVVVDIFIPEDNFEKFYEWYEKDFDFFPLWIVPYQAPEVYPWLDDNYAKGLKNKLFIDCGIYGKPNNKPEIDYSQLLENKTFELNGIKGLISRNHYDKETFWKIYNKERFKKAKIQLDPDNVFGDFYKKFMP